MQLEIFLIAAETSSFTRTAERLRISTSMVSKKISALEADTGVQLFLRDRNRVILTVAGQGLYRDLSRLMNDMEESIHRALVRQQAQEGPLVIGVCESTNVDRYLIPALSAFDSSSGNMAFRIRMNREFEMMEDLISDTLDVAFMSRYLEDTIQGYEALDSLVIAPSPLYAGLSEENPLAEKEIIDMEDLRELKFIMPPAGTRNYYRDWLFRLCADHGFIPREDIHSSPSGDGAHLIINTQNVFITDKYYRDFHTKYIVFREIRDTECGLLMAWNKQMKPQTRRFVNHAEVFFRELR